MKKRAGVANLGAEEVAQTDLKVLTRARTRAQAEALFSQAAAAKAKEQRLVSSFFTQGSDGETMAPVLAKTAAVDEFFAKLAGPTPAQRRYPELLKVSTAPGGAGTVLTPSTTKRVTTSKNGPAPTQSHLSGGAA